MMPSVGTNNHHCDRVAMLEMPEQMFKSTTVK
jgi:hypothetical protein